MIALGAINEEDYYSISANKYDIALQGHYKPDLVLKYKKLGFESSLDTNGYTCLEKNEIKITLTP